MDPDQLVTSISGIKKNVATLGRFASGTPQERRFHKTRIKNGKNFVAVRETDGFAFSPSKFAGYENNGLQHADRLQQRDGRRTDVQITKLVGKPLEIGEAGYADVDRQFEIYCSVHRITPSKHPRARRYWTL